MFLLSLFDAHLAVACRTHLEFLVRKEYLQQEYVAYHVVNYQYLVIATVNLRLKGIVKFHLRERFC